MAGAPSLRRLMCRPANREGPEKLKAIKETYPSLELCKNATKCYVNDYDLYKWKYIVDVVGDDICSGRSA